MKYIVIVLFIFTSINLMRNEVDTNEYYVIPEESIRLRVIANSNSALDQIIKYDLVNKISNIIIGIENESTTISDSRTSIINSISLIENELSELGLDASINYGNNYFPEKTYKGVLYEEGNYESLVVTIGSGLGENWWCVLFPPLCSLETEENLLDETEYTFYVKRIIEKYM